MQLTIYQELIHKVYSAFNARDIDSVFLYMKKDVHWPNGWEGGYVEGQDAVRKYWTRQWKELNPGVEPVSVNRNENGEIEVVVHQLVKDNGGHIMFDGIIKHIYTFEDGLIRAMRIES